MWHVLAFVILMALALWSTSHGRNAVDAKPVPPTTAPPAKENKEVGREAPEKKKSEKTLENTSYTEKINFKSLPLCVGVMESYIVVATADRYLTLLEGSKVLSRTRCDDAVSAMDVQGNRIICAATNDNAVLVLELNGTTLRSVKSTQCTLQKGQVRWLKACYGNWMFTMGYGEDTIFHFWNMDGSLIKADNTNKVQNFAMDMTVIEDDVFLVVGGWSSGVRMFVAKTKNGECIGVDYATEFPTSCGVTALAIHGSECVLCCKDGTLMKYSLLVRYKMAETPKPIFQKKSESTRFSQMVSTRDHVVGVCEKNLLYVDIKTLEVSHQEERIHDGPIRQIIPTSDTTVATIADSTLKLWSIT